MIIECGHCGAPLDLAENRAVFRCRYCGTKNERVRARTVADRTPSGYKPPRTWKPPAEFAADSSVELAYKPDRMALWGLALVLVTVVVPLVVAGGACIEERTGFFDSDPERLARATSLAGSPQALADTLGGKAFDSSLSVDLHADRYKLVSLSYDRDNLTHPTSFAFLPRAEKATCDPEVEARLASVLRGGLDDGGSWSFEYLHIGCDARSGVLMANVRIERNPLWTRQLEAAWRVALAAAFGVDTPVTADERRDLLGAGYPFASLASLPATTTVDHAAATLRERYPGAAIDDSSGVEATVAVDHPLFKSVQLRWMNSRGATLYGANFSPLEPKKFAAGHKALAACLAHTYGAPRVDDADYMKKTSTASWSVPSATIYLSDTILTFSYGGGSHGEPEAYERLIHALQRCP